LLISRQDTEMKNFICVFVLALIFVKPVFSQSNQHSDSSLRNAFQLLVKQERQRLSDSLRMIELQREIEQLKRTKDTNTKELVQELKALKRADSARINGHIQEIESLRESKKGAPVVLNHDTLFTIYADIGPFSASDRAKRTEEELNKVVEDWQFSENLFSLDTNEASIHIYYRDFIIFSVTDEDALWAKTDMGTLAQDYYQVIASSTAEHHKSHNIWAISLRILWALLVLGLLYGFIKLVNLGYSKVVLKLRKSHDKLANGLKIKNYQLLDASQAIRALAKVTSLFRYVVIIVGLYISLPAIFAIFPWTKGIADSLIEWTLTPIKDIFSSIISYIPDLLTVIVIVIFTHYILKGIKYLADEVKQEHLKIPGFYPDWAKPTFNIIRILLLAFAVVVIFPYLPGSDSLVFKGVSVFLGLLVSIGSGSAISNMVAGLVITYMRPFRVGDRIKTGEISGDVYEKNMLVTRIKTIKNEIITVPNSSILASHTVNYTQNTDEMGLLLHTTVSIGYDVPWEKVHQLLIAAAEKTDGIMEDRAPFVLQTKLDDFYIHYELNAYTDEPKKMAVTYSNLHQNILDSFNEADVEILSPHYRAMRDGNESTVPKGDKK
jgi:small-conductance mechanosensitive channel